MRIGGIDPGLNGAFAMFDMEAGNLVVTDLPKFEVLRGGKLKGELNVTAMANMIDVARCDHIFLERVGAMPGQGTSSMFSFGRSVGQIEGVIGALGIRLSYVTPQTWQKACGVRGGKDGSRLRAAELFPKFSQEFARKKDDGRADAALIAWYGATNG